MTKELVKVRAAMVDRFIADLPPEVLQWHDSDAVRDACMAMLDEQLSWCSDESFATLRATRIGIGSSTDYLQRIITVNGVSVLCGIRFYNLDPARPFVELIAWSESSIDFAAAARAAMDAHAVFRPNSVRVFSAGLTPPPLPDDWQVNMDDVLVANTIEMLLTAPHPPNLDRVALADADVDEAAAFVKQGYEAFTERSPDLAAFVEPEDRNELAECRANGRLAWWLVDGDRAGLIAVSQDQLLGLDGYQIMEEVVGASHAGKATAAAAQRRVAESLAETAPNKPLFGTIDARNVPSRRTAARAGRREIAAWWFITPRCTPT